MSIQPLFLSIFLGMGVHGLPQDKEQLWVIRRWPFSPGSCLMDLRKFISFGGKLDLLHTVDGLAPLVIADNQ